MLDQTLQGYVSAMNCDHHQIEQMLKRIEAVLDEVGTKGQTTASKRAVFDQVERLASYLATHFKREEEGGFLDDAAAAAPRFAGEAEKLLSEHGQMLATVHNLVSRARTDPATAAEWDSFAAALRTVIHRLVSHEERENALLARAFNVANSS